MLCEQCGTRRAEIHLVSVVNGEKRVQHLCRECAGEFLNMNDVTNLMKLSFSVEGLMGIDEAFRELVMPALRSAYANKKNARHICPHCGKELPDSMFEHKDGAEQPEAAFQEEDGGIFALLPPVFAADAYISILGQALLQVLQLAVEHFLQAGHVHAPGGEEGGQRVPPVGPVVGRITGVVVADVESTHAQGVFRQCWEHGQGKEQGEEKGSHKCEGHTVFSCFAPQSSGLHVTPV